MHWMRDTRRTKSTIEMRGSMGTRSTIGTRSSIGTRSTQGRSRKSRRRSTEGRRRKSRRKRWCTPRSTAVLIYMMSHLFLSGPIWLASPNVHDILNYSQVLDHQVTATSMCRIQGSSYQQRISKSENYTRRGTQLTGHCHYQEPLGCHREPFNSLYQPTELLLECLI